jgi:hypothetical protein
VLVVTKLDLLRIRRPDRQGRRWVQVVRRAVGRHHELGRSCSEPMKAVASAEGTSIGRKPKLAKQFNVGRTGLAPLSGSPHYSDSNGFSLALTSSTTAAGALQIKRDPRFSQDTLRN